MPPGRPADAQHRRMRIILGTLAAHRAQGVSRRALLVALGKDPAQANDQRILSRDLANLRSSGWHIDTEKVGIEDRYRLRIIDHRLRSSFSDLERAQLLRAARAAGLGQLFDDLDPGTPEGPDAPGDVNLGIAQRAIEIRCLLHFDYNGRSRALHPYDIELAARGWRLRGREDETGLVKVFALERMDCLYLDRPGTAEPTPKDLPPLVLDPLSRVEHAPVEVVVRHAPEHTHAVQAQLGVGGHRSVPTDDPDLVDSIVTVTFVDSFLDRLLEMEQRVRLIGPDSVRHALRDRLLGTLAAHPMLPESGASTRHELSPGSTLPTRNRGSRPARVRAEHAGAHREATCSARPSRQEASA